VFIIIFSTDSLFHYLSVTCVVNFVIHVLYMRINEELLTRHIFLNLCLTKFQKV